MQQRLLDIGDWLEVNGDAIYKSKKRKRTIQENSDQKLYFTSKAGVTYCLFDKWRKEISINLLDSESISGVSLLGWEGEIQWKTEGGKLLIELPEMGLDEIPCSYAWTLKLTLQ